MPDFAPDDARLTDGGYLGCSGWDAAKKMDLVLSRRSALPNLVSARFGYLPSVTISRIFVRAD